MPDQDFRALCAALLPYAESRAEDLTEIAEDMQGDDNFTMDEKGDANAAADAAWAAVEAARTAMVAA
jgi:hypothetical protein